MSKRTWKMEYWPEIVAMLIDANKESGSNNLPAMYDYGDRIRTYMKNIGVEHTQNRKNNSGSYYYIDTPEKMQKFVDNWESLNDLSHYVVRMRQWMKPYEKRYLHEIIYKKRKGEFDALVSENDS
tara:strand:- start:7089 stop:7463 length:375 start_codon:yes stop_codon:yes gene_type:complete